MAVCSIWILGGGGAGAAPRGPPALIGGSQKFMPLKPPPSVRGNSFSLYTKDFRESLYLVAETQS